MSVLKSQRSESKIAFVKEANEIYCETINFLSRLSARYSRLIAPDIAHLAFEVVQHVEMANDIYPSDETRRTQREQHLLAARGALSVLDIQLGNCYDIMMLNPQGCMSSAHDKPLTASEAKARIGRFAESLGLKIASERNQLTNLLKSDKRR